MLANFPYLAVVILIGMGIYTLVFKKNLIRIAIGITIIEMGANLFLITLGYKKGSIAPIYTQAPEGMSMALPTPQALTLTSIVIGVATTALILSIIMIIFKKYGTLNTDDIRRLRG
ncbi:MAG: NADH-quinone oxidoreductase subunit K [Atribacterota bacterium]|nr:NADH-quinone oxidoreductase subunit K [Atribacterota bacterium]